MSPTKLKDFSYQVYSIPYQDFLDAFKNFLVR